MGKFIAGVLTTLIIIFTVYAFKTQSVGNIGLAFFYFSLMCLIYGINFGVWLEKESPSKKI